MGENIPESYFKKLQEDRLTNEDRREFHQWMHTASLEEVQAVVERIALFFESKEDEPAADQDAIISAIEKRINKIDSSGRHTEQANLSRLWPGWRRAIAIAATIAGIGCGYLFLSQHHHQAVQQPLVAKIIPGGNKAILTLGNGQAVILDNAKNGVVANQGNVNVTKPGNGQLAYSGHDDDNSALLNTLTIPRGGQFRIILSDGTKVWLNAATTLKFPVHFSGADRKVELSGEAYFEVAKDKQHPFKVLVNNNSEVKVLGTHFNVMAYPDETAMKTTLLEGSVQVSYHHMQQTIVPGEQAVVASGIDVLKVKTSEAIEWKNGNFNFVHEQLPVIMRKISRWYDVEVSYQGKVTEANFMGTLPRSENITDVLKYLELTGLAHFKISERRVIVMP